MLTSRNQGKEPVAPVFRVAVRERDRMAGASDHVLTIQSLKRHNAVLRSPKSRKAPVSFVVSARPPVCPSVSLRFPSVGSSWNWQWQLLGKICRETSNLVRNAKRHPAVNKYAVHTQVCLSCWQQYKIFHSSTKYFTAVRNILQPYEIFYSSTKYFTATRNILQQYEIFYSSTQYFTAIRNILQQYEIFYSGTKYFTAVHNILQQYEIFYSSTQYFTAIRNILQQYEIFYSSAKYFTSVWNILQKYEIFYRSMKYFTRLRNILQQYEICYSSTKYFTAVWNILQQHEIFYSSTKYFIAIRNILQEYEIFYSSTKYITTRQQHNGNQTVAFPWRHWKPLYKKEWYCCVSMATMVRRKRWISRDR